MSDTEQQSCPRKIFLSRDTTSLALGAEQVADRIRASEKHRGEDIEIVRTGSRGLFWLEPMIEVDTAAGRVAYGPLPIDQLDETIESLLDADCLAGDKRHPLCLGLTEAIPYLAKQQRFSFSRVGVIDPLSLADYQQHGGLAGLHLALTMSAGDILAVVSDSGLRGRGGAAFPTGIKWQTVHDVDSEQKYIVCNADEGDSGSFADRMLMEGDPFSLIEGMIIAGIAVGAQQGYIYLREEYPNAHSILKQAIASAEAQQLLGNNILGSSKHFQLELRLAAGAYICGEETALLESLEGKRGMVRAKPPLPAISGLFGKPTVVNNVLTLAAIAGILTRGAAYYRDYGIGRSRGTLPFQLSGNIKYPGLIELAFGPSLRTLLEDFGGGTYSGRPMRSVQVGGPLGAYLPAAQWDIALDYEAFSQHNAVLGHGGIVVFDDSVDMAEQARFSMEFCRIESCGKCTPCRIGSTRGVELIDKICTDGCSANNMNLLEDLCDTMTHGSLCAMGGMTPIPVQSALQHFAEDFSKQGEQDD